MIYATARFLSVANMLLFNSLKFRFFGGEYLPTRLFKNRLENYPCGLMAFFGTLSRAGTRVSLPQVQLRSFQRIVVVVSTIFPGGRYFPSVQYSKMPNLNPITL
jgi:hypothetical protein